MTSLRGFDIVRISAFALIVVNLSSVHMYLGPVRLLRPGVLFLVLPIVAIALRPSRASWNNLTDVPPAKLVGVLALLALGSGVFGLSAPSTFITIRDRYILNLVFFVLMTVSIRTVRDLALMMWGYVVGIGLVVVLALTVLESDVTMDGLARLNGGRGMYDANDIGMIVLMAIPLCLLFMYNTKGLSRWGSLGVFLGIPVTIALTGSRGAMVGMAVVGIALLLGLKRIKASSRAWVGGCMVVGLIVAAPAGYWDQMETILNPTEDYNVSSEYGRVPLMMRGLGYMASYPVFGVGVGNFGRAEGTISPIIRSRLSRGLSVEWLAPHNTYTQVGAEMGAFAFAIWLALLWQGTIGLLKTYRRLPPSWASETPERRFLRDVCLFLPFMFLAFATTSFFLSHAYTSVPYTLFAMLAATQVLVRKELRKPPGAPQRGRRAPPKRHMVRRVVQAPSRIRS